MGPPDSPSSAPGQESSSAAGPWKVLFSEGASTSARQSLYALGPLGHTIDVCDPQQLGLCRFSTFVRRWLRGPSFGHQPAEYLRFVLERLRDEPYDVLLPTHDQVFLFARYRDELRRRVGLAVPEFDAIRQVQRKAPFVRLLQRLAIPQPEVQVVPHLDELDADWPLPCWVKRSLATAGRGVWQVRDRREMQALVKELRAADTAASEGEFIVQQPGRGDFCVAHAIFQHGRLIASHASRSRFLGAGGAACARESVHHPVAIGHLTRLGSHLAWHGALHAEYFHEPASGAVSFIEANPRIGETVNATLSGVNLCQYLLRVALDEPLEPAPPSRPGVRTHALLTSVLGLAEAGGSRRAVLREAWRWWRRQGLYQDSGDELTRPRDDRLSLLPALWVTMQLIAWPGRARKLIQGAVEHYALNEATARQIEAWGPLEQ